MCVELDYGSQGGHRQEGIFICGSQALRHENKMCKQRDPAFGVYGRRSIWSPSLRDQTSHEIGPYIMSYSILSMVYMDRKP